MKMEDFKERFNQGLQKLMEMAKTSRVSAEVEGGEDK
jgi:hypothetical protein